MKQKRLQSVALSLLLAGALAFTGAFASTANAAAYTFEASRLSGARREDVAKKVSDTFFTTPEKARRVILVNDTAFADAISSTNISQGKYPILYSHKTSMPEATVQALRELKPSQVYIMGGRNSVSEAVATEVQKITGNTPIRVGGKDRYEVSANAAEYRGAVKNVLVTTGLVYSDALIAAPYAQKKDAAVLLVGNTFPQSVENYLKKADHVKAEIIGGTHYVPESYASKLRSLTGSAPSRISGANRYEVSAAVASKHFSDAKNAFLASGQVFSDALSASSAAQKLNAPILLTQKYVISTAVLDAMKANNKLNHLYAMGGVNTIAESVLNTVKSAVNRNEKPTDSETNPKYGATVDISKLPTAVREALPTLKNDMSTEGAEAFVAKLNEKRVAAGLKPLTYDKNLSVEAAYRLMTLKKTGALPTGGQYWAGDEYYRVTDISAISNNLMDNVDYVFNGNGGSGSLTAIGLAKYDGNWAFYLGGDKAAASESHNFDRILGGQYDDAQISTVLALLNQEREAAGVGKVVIDPVLAKLAKARAKESTGLMSHIRPDKTKYQEEFDYTNMYLSMGESIGSVPTAKGFVDSLMNHGPHRHSVLRPDFTHVGIGVYAASNGRYYWDVVWAKQGSGYTENFKLKDLSYLYRK